VRPQRPDDITSSDRIRHGSTGERRVLDGHIRPLYILPLSKPAGHSTPKIGPPPTCAHTVTEYRILHGDEITHGDQTANIPVLNCP